MVLVICYMLHVPYSCHHTNICLNDVLWTTTKMKPSFCTNRCANIARLYLESRTSHRSVEVFAGNGRYNAHEVVELLPREDHRTVEQRR